MDFKCSCGTYTNNYVECTHCKQCVCRKCVRSRKHVVRKIKIPIWGKQSSAIQKITSIFETKYLDKFKENVMKDNLLSIYEEAAGFTPTTRAGSRVFCNIFGRFFEDICATSTHFTKNTLGGHDGFSTDVYYECKSRFNTMKGSTAVAEIAPKLQAAIYNGKKFMLLVLTDIGKTSRNISLHMGCSMSKIQTINGYNPIIHRWVSGDEIWKTLFFEDSVKIRDHVLLLLNRIKN